MPSSRMPPQTAVRVLDNLTTAVLMFDDTLHLTSINPAGEMLFEVSAKKIVGQRLDELVPRSGRLVRALRQAVESCHPFTAHGIRLQLPGRKMLTLDCTVTPLLDADTPRTPPVLLVELTQVDRLLRLTREENTLERQAANRAVLRGLAHEIKNPLGGLRGAAQLLARQLPDKALQEYTRVIIHEADRLRNLVDRMMGPYQALQKQSVNIHHILEHVRLLLLAEVPEGLTIQRDYDPSLPELEGDPEQLIQAVLNIARNSVQALDGRGVIQLRTRIERGFTIGQERYRLVLRATVEDNGPGIPVELLDRIFYPMVTGRSDGTGLGLSIAQDIVTRHGGLIECTSRTGQTRFTLYLPLENGHG